MSKFDDVASLYEQKQSELFDLVREVLTSGIKTNNLTEQSKGSNEREYRILVPDFKLDPRWLSISDVSAEERDKFTNALAATNLPRNINDLRSFIDGINKIVQGQRVNVRRHTEQVSRLQLLRAFWNLAQTKTDKTVAGFLFEVLMALAFGGRRLPPTGGDKDIVDIVFPDQPVSLKFIDTGATDIKGSIKNLNASLAKHGAFKYIIASKVENGIAFSEFTITKENKQFLPNYVDDESRTQFRGSLKKIIASKDIKYTEIGIIDFGDIELKTERILAALNRKFEQLLTTLLDLNKQVSELLYVAKDKEKTKSKAADTVQKAQDTKDSAEKIRDK